MRIKMILAMTLAGCMALAGASTGAQKAAGKTPVKTVLLAETDAPPDVKYLGAAPGENRLFDRGFTGAPPQIPHETADFTVSLETNDCAGCHEAPEPGDASTPIPVSHKRDGKISGDRYQCPICHVPQADVKPLVKNRNDALKVAAKSAKK